MSTSSLKFSVVRIHFCGKKKEEKKGGWVSIEGLDFAVCFSQRVFTHHLRALDVLTVTALYLEQRGGGDVDASVFAKHIKYPRLILPASILSPFSDSAALLSCLF